MAADKEKIEREIKAEIEKLQKINKEEYQNEHSHYIWRINVFKNPTVKSDLMQGRLSIDDLKKQCETIESSLIGERYPNIVANGTPPKVLREVESEIVSLLPGNPYYYFPELDELVGVKNLSIKEIKLQMPSEEELRKLSEEGMGAGDAKAASEPPHDVDKRGTRPR